MSSKNTIIKRFNFLKETLRQRQNMLRIQNFSRAYFDPEKGFIATFYLSEPVHFCGGSSEDLSAKFETEELRRREHAYFVEMLTKADPKPTLKQIGIHLNVSGERVRQILAKRFRQRSHVKNFREERRLKIYDSNSTYKDYVQEMLASFDKINKLL